MSRTPYDENIARQLKEPNWRNEGGSPYRLLECQREGYLRCLKDVEPLVEAAREALQSGSQYVLFAGLANALAQFDDAHEAKP